VLVQGDRGVARERSPHSSEVGSVVVDIGGDVGAAIVATEATCGGQEMEIRPDGGVWDGTHVSVLPRHFADGTIWAALFPALPAGRYEVRLRGQVDGPLASFEVTGGRVTHAHLGSSPLAGAGSTGKEH
jgi:hypothetical protein